MYQYDTFDQALVDARVDDFRDQVARRLAGDITEDQFKPMRLMNGLYLQLHAYMLRVAIPYGTLDSRQMRMLGHIARKYDRGYGHFTTRQNIQYNWIKLAECPDLLADLASVEMHAIQTSGNCIRNISSDQYAGAAADEVTDPRVWAELLRQWSSFHPEFSFLPRKFKIAVIASKQDRAAMRLHDIGIEMVERDGVLGGRVFVGGGMGRTPMIAPEIREFVTANDLLSYVEACLRVYNRYGRRDNIYKARIKILVHELGANEYRRQVEEEFLHVKTLGLDPPQAEFDRISAFFAPPTFEKLNDDLNLSDPAFAAWVAQNTVPHKVSGYAIANISLKPVGGIPGDATADQIDTMADRAEFGGDGEHREVLDTYRMFAYDEGWGRRINEAIDSGLTAEAAIERVQQRTRMRMRQIDDPLLADRMHDLDTRVADQHVHTAVRGDHFGHCRIDLVLIGHVHRHCHGGAAAPGNFFRSALCSSLVEIGNNHFAAFAREGECDLFADAAGGTGDDTDLVLEFHGAGFRIRWSSGNSRGRIGPANKERTHAIQPTSTGRRPCGRVRPCGDRPASQRRRSGAAGAGSGAA